MSLTMGALRVNPSADVLGWYNTMYGSLGVGGWCTSDTIGLVNLEAQDQARLVPAPGAMALLALAGVAGRQRRRR
jgi:MYXO-CTERM domain-containing protein